ncbi:Uu.00g010400.m01.CDS01 [Anthostomella pinea]|uniref:Uu.00g010400.m01.CDS01 n=1 Tax=Anthostomella pinea TaxID=933095 RepID=A0AAI8YQ47_9PEZI|nr:Uu.00g010400.m01.CDS01 [Anthostomella pinea]
MSTLPVLGLMFHLVTTRGAVYHHINLESTVPDGAGSVQHDALQELRLEEGVMSWNDLE